MRLGIKPNKTDITYKPMHKYTNLKKCHPNLENAKKMPATWKWSKCIYFVDSNFDRFLSFLISHSYCNLIDFILWKMKSFKNVCIGIYGKLFFLITKFMNRISPIFYQFIHLPSPLPPASPHQWFITLYDFYRLFQLILKMAVQS